jgi:hypothetical protein
VFAKYAKVLLLTPTTGSLVVCSLGIVAGGVFLARLEAADHAKATVASHRVVAERNIPRALIASVPTAKNVALPVASPTLTQRRHAEPVVLATTMKGEDRDMLLQYVGMPAKDAIRSERFRYYMDSVIPYAPIHYHVDLPLTQALSEVLGISSEPTEVHDGRYMMLTTTRSDQLARRGFLWIDLQNGAAFGGIFFRPSNGEPSPTLTLFSKRVVHADVHTRQLPARFVSDLQRWSAAAELPPVLTRYFVNAASRKSVLLHEDNYCGSKPDVACEELNAKAASIDATAKSYLGLVHYASNATMRTASMHMPLTSAQAE